MKPLWQLFRVTVLKRPWIFALLTLFYLVALFVAAGSVAEELWLGIAVLCVIPTAGIVGIVSERIVLLCQSAGELKIPRHAQRVRLFQLLTLSIVAVPVAAVALARSDVLAVAAMLGGAAVVGSWLVARPPLVAALLAAAFLLRDFADWLVNDHVQAALLALEVWALADWLRLPSRAEAAGAVRISTLADSRHEAAEEPRTKPSSPEATAPGGPRDENSAAEVSEVEDSPSLESPIDSAADPHAHRADRRMTAADLGFAVGFDSLSSTRERLIWCGIACVVVLAWYFVRSSAAGYLVVGFFTVLAVLNRASALYDAWRDAAGEQSLLFLAPSWPRADALKPALANLVVARLPTAWLVWLAATSAALAVGAIHRGDAVDSAVFMAALSSAVVGNLLLSLTRPKRRNWRLSWLFVFGAPAVATIAIVLPQFGMPLVMALALLVAPVVVGAALFWRRSLPFPVNLVR